EENQLYRDLLGPRAADLLLIPSDGGSPASLPFDSASTLKYYEDWCSSGNDCPDAEFPLDCTHFACHGLLQSKVKVNMPEATCANGLCIRVAELGAAFFNATKKYSNVTKIASHTSTKKATTVLSLVGLDSQNFMSWYWPTPQLPVGPKYMGIPTT